jgi:hypothetical protein
MQDVYSQIARSKRMTKEKKILIAVDRNHDKEIGSDVLKVTFNFVKKIEKNIIDIVVAMSDLVYEEDGGLTYEAYNLSKKIHSEMNNSLATIFSSSKIQIERMSDSEQTFSIVCDQKKIEPLARSLETWVNTDHIVNLYDHIKNVWG